MDEVRFLFPMDGDVLLGGADGIVEDGQLMIDIRLLSPDAVEVNGIPTKKTDGVWTACIPLAPGRNAITAITAKGETATIRVLYWQGANRHYRFTVDDCIRCFQDLAEHPRASIFENDYLALWKEAHDRYGSLVHINAFERSVEGTFDLSMMPEIYREEFRSNADWLSITFHSVQEFPDKPYQFADHEQVARDCARITAEIERFAGKEVLHDTTTLHWGEANAEGVRALRDAGFKSLSAYLSFYDTGEPMVSYHLTHGQVARAAKREGWMDFDLDVFFPKLDFVLNAPEFTADRVPSFLKDLSRRPTEGQFIQTVIHEQYFYSDYHHYEPDYRKRVLTMAEWMSDNGYSPASMSDLTRGLL